MKKLNFYVGLWSILFTCSLVSIQAGSISGTVDYQDSETGNITVVATSSLDGNKALQLDGDGDYVVVESVQDLSGSEITIQYWFRGSSIQSAVRQQGGGWIVAGWNNSHIISNDGGVNGIEAGPLATDGNWHHLVLSWKQGAPGGFASYLDGRLVESRDAADDPIPSHNSPLYFGAFQGQFEFANGELDEIAIWQKALTTEEVAATWYKKLNGDEEGLVGYWDFDDETADDRSPNEHHGQIMGDAWTVDAEIPGLGAFYTTEITAPGAYRFDNVPDGSGYQLFAFLDVNEDGVAGELEPQGRYSGNPFDVAGDLSNADILLLERPEVNTQPMGTRVGAGENVELSITASGSSPLTFQWSRNGNHLSDGGNISGANSPTLLLKNAVGADSGAYKCIVDNAAGEAISKTVILQVVEGGVSISGTIDYEGVQEGPVIIKAAQIQAGNRVLSLDGDGDYAITPLTNLSGDELTIQYWFKGKDIQSAVRQQSAGYIVAGWYGSHILSFDGGTAGPDAGSAATDGNWHQLTMSWKRATSGGFATYLDGALIERRDSADVEVPDINAQVYFGAFNGVGEFANGQLDEIAIWERALTEAEVQSGWNQPLSGNEKGLLGFWNFDDGMGADLSALGNDAELHGDAAIIDETIPGLGGAVFTGILESPGSFTLANVLPGKNFEVTVFMDVNENGGPDASEPSGSFGDNPFNLNENATQIDITLTEPPSIGGEPLDERVAQGGEATFNAEVMGSKPLTYTWSRNGVGLSNGGKVSGADSAQLSIQNASAADAGSYSVAISNAKGEIFSREAKLSVIADGVSITGKIHYSGSPAGDIHLTAAQFVPGNKALTLDGRNDFVAVPELVDLSGPELSIQYWFRGKSVQSAVRQQGGGWVVTGWNGLHILSNDGGVGGISAGDSVTDGNWHHVIFTWEVDAENGFRSYLDGKLVAARDSSDQEIPVHDAPLYFGSFNGVGEFAEGELDEIAIWYRALKPSEIEAQWNLPLTGKEDGLFGFWNFDDGTAKDLSPNAYHGEFSGDATTVDAYIPGFAGEHFTDVIASGGDFTMANLPKGENYHIYGFVDLNGNFVQDPDEPASTYAGNPFDLDTAKSGVAIDLGGESLPAVITLTREGQGITLSWDPSSGLRLFATDSLNGGQWTKVEGAVDGSITLSTDQVQQFFQLRE
jgi:hypothetical protein